ncbi:MAG: PilZ domain-containing protein [Deltaproteobacteria bacterium]|nr:PilZ domain-containing protein [Deltaproteobacteria bacterium]
MKSTVFGEAGELMADGRLSRRISAEEFDGNSLLSLTIHNLAMDTSEAWLLNISDTGMAVTTPCALELGQMVGIAARFKKRIPNKAVVMWSLQENGEYRSGLKFVSAM